MINVGLFIHVCLHMYVHGVLYILLQVMDEADRLLDASFAEDLQVIFDSVRKERQTLFFSATLSDSLNRLQQLAVNKPFCWQAPLE